MITILKVATNSFEFKILNKGGQPIFKSTPFSSEDEIRHLLTTYSTKLFKPGVIERRTNHQGRFLFCLKDENGKVIGRSISYDSEAGMENAIKNLRELLAS